MKWKILPPLTTSAIALTCLVWDLLARGPTLLGLCGLLFVGIMILQLWRAQHHLKLLQLLAVLDHYDDQQSAESLRYPPTNGEQGYREQVNGKRAAYPRPHLERMVSRVRAH